ncbi:Dyp-type peroxidase [Umezawaea sp. NPDC059074]|uniref:Dyp-type peroxidase n=1 Tax=Umezawaea sp. NPDC059074 TaxID=3346716 RepID=UPI0036C82AED
MTQLSRRRLLQGMGAVGLAAGCAGPAPVARLDPHGPRQAGVARPAVPQAHCDVSVWDLADVSALPAISGRVTELAERDLTVTVGLGPRFADVDPLPEFAGERLDHAGGDLLLQICGDDLFAVSTAVAELGRLAGAPRWRQTGFRGPAGADGAARNTLGFTDGVVVPRGDEELDREVWCDDGSTVAVVRRMRLDLDGFAALPVAEQERVFGRRKETGEPLSGGSEVDLGAKTPDGQYLIPVDAHVRRAHPLTSGSGLMLRRSYNYDNGMADRGLLFVSFQRELRTFVNTMHRMAEGDALLTWATTTASAAFRILPGFTPDRPLTTRGPRR